MKENSLRMKLYFKKVDSNEAQNIISSYKEEICSGSDLKETYNKYSNEIKEKKTDGYKFSCFILFLINIILLLICILDCALIYFIHSSSEVLFNIVKILSCSVISWYFIPFTGLFYFILLITRKIKFKNSKLLFLMFNIALILTFIAILGLLFIYADGLSTF